MNLIYFDKNIKASDSVKIDNSGTISGSFNIKALASSRRTNDGSCLQCAHCGLLISVSEGHYKIIPILPQKCKNKSYKPFYTTCDSCQTVKDLWNYSEAQESIFYSRILEFAYQRRNDESIKHAYSYIAKKVGCSEKTVQRAFDHFLREGIIFRYQKNGMYKSKNTFVLNKSLFSGTSGIKYGIRISGRWINQNPNASSNLILEGGVQHNMKVNINKEFNIQHISNKTEKSVNFQFNKNPEEKKYFQTRQIISQKAQGEQKVLDEETISKIFPSPEVRRAMDWAQLDPFNIIKFSCVPVAAQNYAANEINKFLGPLIKIKPVNDRYGKILDEQELLYEQRTAYSNNLKSIKDPTKFFWSKVWKFLGPNKLKCLMWRVQTLCEISGIEFQINDFKPKLIKRVDAPLSLKDIPYWKNLIKTLEEKLASKFITQGTKKQAAKDLEVAVKELENLQKGGTLDTQSVSGKLAELKESDAKSIH